MGRVVKNGLVGGRDVPGFSADDILRTQPLGYDRYGLEYWLTTAQQNMTVSALGSNLHSESVMEPAVIIRDRTLKSWKQHSGVALDTLLNNLSSTIPCEMVLKGNLAQKLLTSRHHSASDGALKVRESQGDLLKTQKKCVKWLTSLSPGLTSRLTPKEVVKLLELIWARCIEIRLISHYAIIRAGIPDLPDENDPNKYDREHYLCRRKIRDQHVEQCLDFHPTQGWQRQDNFCRIREIGANTTATKLLAEPSLHQNLISAMTKSRLRKPFDPSKDTKYVPVEVVDEEEEGDEEVTDAAGSSSLRVQSSRSSAEKPITSQAEVNEDAPNDEDDDDDNGEDEEGAAADVCLLRPGVKPIDQIDLESKQVLRRYSSGAEAARTMRASQSGISLCCKGVKTDSYGFIWRFADDGEYRSD